jgi:hypothetical protein
MFPSHDQLPEIDKLALLGGTDDERLKSLDFIEIFKDNGGTFGFLQIKVRVKDVDDLVYPGVDGKYAGKEGYLFPYIHYDSNRVPYINIRINEFIEDDELKGGGRYQEPTIYLDNIYPIDYDEINSDFVKYQGKVEADRQAFRDRWRGLFGDDWADSEW